MATGHEGPLAEFVALRQEIDSRNRNQHQILTLQLTTAGGIFALAITEPDFLAIMILVPFTSYLLCGRFATQGHAVQRIAEYIMTKLDPAVPGGLGWEAWQRDRKRHDYRLGWLVPLLISFPGAGVVAIGWAGWLALAGDPPFAATPIRLLAAAACAVGLLLLLVAGYQVWRLEAALPAARPADRRAA